MPSLVLLMFVAAFAFVWVRSTRRRRARWLRRLNLPGIWLAQGEGSDTLELSGSLNGGSYRFGASTGRWRLSGSRLTLQRDDGEMQTLILTFYDIGKIGLERKSGLRTYFRKAESNVVPLHRRA